MLSLKSCLLRPLYLLASLALFLVGCTPAPASQPVTLNVLAAASLTDALKEAGVLYEARNPGIRLQFNFAGSQQLASQVSAGAPADIFASANPKQMEAAAQSGRIDLANVKILALNKLVVINPQDNRAGLKTLQDLGKPGLKLVLAAREVPVGQYSLDFLDKASGVAEFGADFKEKVLKNVVSYEENVKSVLTKVALGEADAGIVYTTDAAGRGAGQTGQVAIPDGLNVSAEYPLAPLKDSPVFSAAQSFISYLLSSEGQAILGKYGFLPPSR